MGQRVHTGGRGDDTRHIPVHNGIDYGYQRNQPVVGNAQLNAPLFIAQNAGRRNLAAAAGSGRHRHQGQGSVGKGPAAAKEVVPGRALIGCQGTDGL